MAQLIRGTDIILYTETGAEPIPNVLIGEPQFAQAESFGGSTVTYTLAILKGDTHDWTDRVVSFFGQMFRTVGSPVQGIEANIPLAWNKKITVRQLAVNGIVTIYESGNFARHIYPQVYLRDHRGSHVMKTGAQKTGRLTVRIHAVVNTDSYIPKPGDMIVPTECDFVFDTASEQSISASMMAFRRQFAFAVIREVSEDYCGTLPDFITEAE